MAGESKTGKITTDPQNFAIIGAAGYVAPRHMRAIKDTGNLLVAALDKSDSVGVLDQFAFDIAFFTEFERFDRHAEKLKRLGEATRLHYVSICSPNYLHDAHIRFALRIGAHAICEKPLVINPWNLDALADIEKETGKKIFNVLQLRVHPAIKALKEKVATAGNHTEYHIDLKYITSRGNWYFNSWKGNTAKSGGIVSNIGIHFFDMLIWIFGGVKSLDVYFANPQKMMGVLRLKNAIVRWFLSVDQRDLPLDVLKKGGVTFRSIKIDDSEIEFSGGFTDLHTLVYRDILDGKGYGIEDARPSIDLVHHLRKTVPETTGEADAKSMLAKLF